MRSGSVDRCVIVRNNFHALWTNWREHTWSWTLVTPTFLFRNRFYLQLSPHCPEMNKKSMWEDFCPRDMESCHLAAARHVKLWSLNAQRGQQTGPMAMSCGISSDFCQFQQVIWNTWLRAEDLKIWYFYFYPKSITALSKLCPERLPAMSWTQLKTSGNPVFKT